MRIAVNVLMLSVMGAYSTPGFADTGSPVSLEIQYTAEVWSSVLEPTGHDARYLDNADIVMTADLDAIANIPNTTLTLYGLYNNGVGFSDGIVGDVLTISNIETPVRAARLYEAYLEHRPSGGPVSIRFGLYDVNAEFDALETSSFFIGSAHGIGADISQSGENGPSIFPVTSLAVRTDVEINNNWTLRTALLDAVPGDPDNPGRTTVKLSGDEGALWISESDFKKDRYRLLTGYWRYTEPVEVHAGGAIDHNYGGYIRGETSIIQSGPNNGRQVNAFFRAGWANGEVNDFSSFYSLGVVLDGVVRSDGEDQLGLAYATARTSDQLRRLDSLTAAHESVIELSYRMPFLDCCAVQPNLQYVLNPGLNVDAEDALALGLRLELGWRNSQ